MRWHLWLIFFLAFPISQYAQKAIHWPQYIRLQPGYLGPNALPVPEVSQGRVSNEVSTTIAFESHINSGDKTQNIFLNCEIPLAKDLVAIHAKMVAIEYWNLNSVMINERTTRDEDGRGFSVGDLYLGTIFRVIKDRRNLPDATLGMQFKLPSGSQLENARHTDAGGYFLNLSLGKNLPVQNKEKSNTRIYGHLGFYVWQTGDHFHRQNDAWAIGLGFETQWEKLSLSNEFSSYWGYINDRDRPLNYRIKFEARIKNYLPFVRYQFSYNSIIYHSMRIGCSYTFERKFRFLNRKNVINQ